MEREILAAAMAAVSDIDLTTNDRIEACATGHGSLNVALCCVANVVAEEIQRGADISVRFTNTRSLPLDDVLAKAIGAARDAGADSANAALLSAVLLYLAGSNAQAGVPAGSRKLGAMARIAAGVDRCGVAAIPSIKIGNKVSGFAAVQAIYQAMAQGKLTEIKGERLPPGLGPIFGHGPFGEEIAFPQIAKNAGRIGTRAVIDAMAATGAAPAPLSAALLGSAAALEIVHPDAWLPDAECGFTRGSARAVGRAAAEEAGLPKEMHVFGTDEVYETANLVGDIALILKDIGGPSVVGIIAMHDALGIFKEAASGLTMVSRSHAHHGEDAALAMKILLHSQFDFNRAVAIMMSRGDFSFDPETIMLGVNTVARKAEQVRRGPVTRLMIQASEPMRGFALYRRALKTYQGLTSGRKLADIVRELDEERQRLVEQRCSRLLSNALGKQVAIKILKLGSRGSKGKLSRWWSLDAYVDMEVSIDGERTLLEDMTSKVLADVMQRDDPKFRQVVTLASRPLRELSTAGNNILNITVPAAVAAVLDKASPTDAAKTAEDAAFLTAGIPGARQKAEEVAHLAIRILKGLSSDLMEEAKQG
jgi:hypothetical protein